MDALGEIDGLTEGDKLADILADAETEGDKLGLTLGETDALTEGE